MNAGVDIERQSAVDVAAAYVEEKGLGSGRVRRQRPAHRRRGQLHREPDPGQRLRRRPQRRGVPGHRADRGPARGLPAGAAARRVPGVPGVRRHPGRVPRRQPRRGGRQRRPRRQRRDAAWPRGGRRADLRGAGRGSRRERLRDHDDAAGGARRDHDAVGAGRGVLGRLAGPRPAPPECPTRPFCQPGLEEVYGFTFASVEDYDLGTPTNQAVLQGEVSLALALSTDPIFASSRSSPPELRSLSTSRRGATAPRR